MSNIKLSNLKTFEDVISKSSGSYYQNKWIKILDKEAIGWGKLVKNQKNWQAISDLRPLEYYEVLCSVILDCAGFNLSKKWFVSENNEQKEASIIWFSKNLEKWLNFDTAIKIAVIEKFDNFLKGINVEIWQDLNDEMKTLFISKLFEKEDRKEPFCHINRHNHRLDDIRHHLSYYLDDIRHNNSNRASFDDEDFKNALLSLSLPVFINYFPSVDVSKVMHIIMDANDQKWLNRLEKMIEDRTIATENNNCVEIYNNANALIKATMKKSNVIQRRILKLNSKQHSLIELFLEKAQSFGFTKKELPQIFYSNETPPLINRYPDFFKKGNSEDSKRPEYYDPEYYDIEQLLGCYFSNQQHIVIYDLGIKWCSARLKVDKKVLLDVVLIHELSHWLTHLLPETNSVCWDLENYIRSSTFVHEGLAQLITRHFAGFIKNTSPEFLECFEKLNQHQSPPYHVYEDLVKSGEEACYKSIEKLRNLVKPAELQDLQVFIKLFPLYS